MNVIFLDIDGVLNNEKTLQSNVHIHPYHVVLINKLCVECNAKVVISSSWRIMVGFRLIKDHLRISGLDDKFVIDKTPVMPQLTRGEEIKEWIKWSDADISNYVIIDDDDDFCDDQLNNFVQTSFKFGFTTECYDKAKNILLNR